MSQYVRMSWFGALCLAAAASTAAAQPQPGAPVQLTLQEAERLAADNHPLVRAGRFAALAAGEAVREVKSAYFPTASVNLTGATAIDGTRVTAGALNNPTILDRLAAGVGVSQMLTDFGRTNNLVASSRYTADAHDKDVDARRADVLLQVDRAYFDALRAQAVLKVARETVDERKLVVDQIEALAASNLKSGLDLSFAKVSLGEAQLLLVQAQNDVEATYAALSAATGSSRHVSYELTEESLPAPPEADSAAVVARALRDRPDLAAERLADEASVKYAEAERLLYMPSISFVGAAGFTPYHQIGLSDRYSAAGINVSIPVANGSLFAARKADAAFRAQAQTQAVRDYENRITRDVTVAWLDARTAYQRLDLTTQLLAQAADALELATARYNLGLGSIVELTQAQLNHTRAEIDQATSRYQFQIQTASLRYQTGALQ